MEGKRWVIRILVLLIFFLVFTHKEAAATDVCGTISTDSFWIKAASPYVVKCNVATVSGVTLTIEPGVVVKFSGIVSLSVGGTLLAQGTAADPIVFTSILDDTAGGDTNGDGSSTIPQPGDWNRVSFGSGSIGNVLDHVMVRYARIGLDIGADDVSVSHSTIEDSGYYGIQIDTADPMIDSSTIQNNPTGVLTSDSTFTLTNNIITDNDGWPVTLYNSSNSTISGNTISGNGTDGLRVGGPISSATTWSSLDAAYVITSFFNGVASGVTLTIEPGVVVKFIGIVSLHVNGTLLAEGTSADSIVFTSILDDTAGGDTNSDESSTSPQPGNWNRISFGSGSIGNVLDHVTVRYARIGLYIGADDVSVNHSTIENSGNYGIQIDTAGPIIARTNIARNPIGVFASNSGLSAIRIENNLIYENTGTGIYMTTGAYNFAVLNNTITSNVGSGAVVFSGAEGTFKNNIIADNSGSGIFCTQTPEPEIAYNNVWNNAAGDYSGCGPGTEDISVNPLFEDAVSQNYALQPESPCIDAGTSDGTPLRDYEGKARYDDPFTEPNSGGGPLTYYDIGAYEYNPLCEDDFDNDGDVDGSDLANVANNVEIANLSDFAFDFGRADCPVFPLAVWR